MHPSVVDALEHALRTAGLQCISCDEFQALKHRILTINEILENHGELDDEARQHVIRFLDGDEQSMKVLADSQRDPESKSVFSWLRSLFEKDAKKPAFTTSDPHFLAGLNDIVAEELFLQPSAQKALQIAQTYVREKVQKMLKKLTHKVMSIFQNACLNQIHREVTHNEEERKENARKEFIQGFNECSQNSPSLYVT